MPPPTASGSVLAKCSTTLLCYLRAAPLWAFVLLIFIGGLVRQRFFARAPSKPEPNKQRVGKPT